VGGAAQGLPRAVSGLGPAVPLRSKS